MFTKKVYSIHLWHAIRHSGHVSTINTIYGVCLVDATNWLPSPRASWLTNPKVVESTALKKLWIPTFVKIPCHNCRLCLLNIIWIKVICKWHRGMEAQEATKFWVEEINSKRTDVRRNIFSCRISDSNDDDGESTAFRLPKMHMQIFERLWEEESGASTYK